MPAWTRSYWAFAHTLAETYDHNKSNQKPKAVLDFFISFGTLLPCPKCTHHYNQYLQRDGVLAELTTALKTGKEALTQWVIALHNHVNTSLGYPVYSGEAALDEHNRLVQAAASSEATPGFAVQILLIILVVILGLLFVRFKFTN